MILFHANKKAVDVFIESLHVIEPNEPYEVDDHTGQVILAQKWYAGLVSLPLIKDKLGFRYDTEAGLEQAKVLLATAKDKLLRDWIDGQYEDRVKQGKPPLPPTGFVLEYIQEASIDLDKQYSLKIPGFETPAQLLAKEQQEAQKAAEVDELKGLVARLSRQVKDLLDNRK